MLVPGKRARNIPAHIHHRLTRLQLDQLFAVTIVSPQEPNGNDNHNYDRDVYFAKHLNDATPVASEERADCSHGSHPYRCAQHIEQDEPAPRHAQDARQRASDHPETEHETRDEDRGRSVAFERTLPFLESVMRDPEETLVFLEQRSATTEADPITEIVAEDGRENCHGNEDR